MRVVLALVVVSGCGSSSDTPGDARTGDATHDGGTPLDMPRVNGKVDYQLGGAYPPALGVEIVVRDRKATRADGLYNICYINGFQVQPEDEKYWLDVHPDLLLRDSGGNIVRDPDWNEMLLDIRLAERRTAIASIIGGWIRECAQNSYDAIEIDNLDSFSRSRGLLLENQAVLTMKQLADHAHAVGLPVAQKNAAELVARKAELGTDFAVAEECNRYGECSTYTSGYGDHVIVVEYRQQDFTAGCSEFPNLSIVLRDQKLTTPANAAYVYDGC